MPRASALRRAFTLIELLVVIAIIAVLIALLVPAVQRVRESANRTTCENNLKQLAMGVLHYENVYKHFPPSGKSYGWCQQQANQDPILYNLNGWVLVLPFIEQEGLFKQYDLTQASGDLTTTCCCSLGSATGTLAGSASNGNAALSSKVLEVFRCPSDNGVPTLPPTSPTPCYSPTSTTSATKTNYDFCTSSDFRCNAWKLLEPAAARRMFGENSDTRIAQVTDGTSTTIMLAEATYEVWNGRCTAWGFRGWVQVGINPGQTYINNWNDVFGTPIPTKYGRLGSWSYMGSLHPSGANAAFADGSVRFLSEGLDVTTLNRLAAMADGTVTNLP